MTEYKSLAVASRPPNNTFLESRILAGSGLKNLQKSSHVNHQILLASFRIAYVYVMVLDC